MEVMLLGRNSVPSIDKEGIYFDPTVRSRIGGNEHPAYLEAGNSKGKRVI